jgi:hypothetical protein
LKHSKVSATAVVALALALPCGIPTLMPAASHAFQQKRFNRYNGLYAYGGGRAGIRAIDRAIEDVTEEMGWLASKIATRRLRDKTRPWERLRIRVNRNVVAVGGDELWRSPLNGRPRTVRGEDDRYHIRHRFVSGRLRQELWNDSVSCKNTFSLGPRNRRLDIRVHITSPDLPESVDYSLTYHRIR